jgi:hypothetical protein
MPEEHKEYLYYRIDDSVRGSLTADGDPQKTFSRVVLADDLR